MLITDTGPPQRPARRPNLLLRRQRELRGWGQQEVADRLVQLGERAGIRGLQCSGGDVSRWERGLRRPRWPYSALLCQLYEVDGDQLGLTSRPTDPSADERLDDDVERREFFEYAAAVLGAAAVTPMRIPDILSAIPPAPDEAAVDGVRAITARYRRLDDAVVASELLHPVERHLRLALQLLSRAESTSLRQQLAAAASECAGFSAWLSIDAGNAAAATQHYRVAMTAAQRAGDALLAAYMLGSIATLADEEDDAQQALALCQTARTELHRGAPPSAHAWLDTVEALAHSRAGSAEASMAALRRAESAVERAAASEWPWLYPFGPEKVAAARGMCHLHLNEPEAAEAVLRESLTTGGLSSRRRGDLLVGLADARLSQHDLDDGCSLLSQALTLAQQRQSRRLVERVHVVRGRLGQWADSSPVVALDRQLHAVSL